jgi:beta-xylosidase
VYGNNQIRVAQLSADGFSEVRNQIVLNTTPASVGGPLEGARFYKKDGVYYILLTQYANGEWVMRSTTGPFGPYEGPRQFAVRLPYAGAPGSGGSPHQGGIVGTQNGQWYYVGFNDSYPAGRIPVMIPVTWSDGWPAVTLTNGQFGGSYPFPDLPCGANRVRARNADDHFEGPTLAPEWEWNHNPDNSKWSLDNGLTLQAATVTNDLYAARNTLTRRIEGPASIATIELDYSKMQDGDVAGLAALRDRSAWIGVKRSGAGTRVVMTGGVDMSTSWQTTSTGSEVAGADVSGGKIWLRVEANVRTNAGGGQARFSYSADGAQFTSLGGTLTMNKDWQYFLGYRFGIFHFATKATGGSVKIGSFTLDKP